MRGKREIEGRTLNKKEPGLSVWVVLLSRLEKILKKLAYSLSGKNTLERKSKLWLENLPAMQTVSVFINTKCSYDGLGMLLIGSPQLSQQNPETEGIIQKNLWRNFLSNGENVYDICGRPMRLLRILY